MRESKWAFKHELKGVIVMTRDNQRYWVAKTMRMASYLIDHGFECIGTAPDFNNPKYKVFLFDMTVPGFKECLDEWLERVQQYKQN